MSRFRLVFVALVAAFALLLQGVVPASASEAGVRFSGEAADFLSARVQAEASGKRVLVGSALDEFSSTWVNPDGTRTTESFGSPIRVRDEGGHFGWRDLDFTLVENVDGTVGARSGLLPLTISGGGSAAEVAATGLVSVVQAEGRSFGFGFDGALPKPVLEGDTARFVEVFDGVDLLVRLDATGFEQFFEVKRKPSVVVLDQLRVGLKSRNVTVVENSHGGFDFVVAGESVASMVEPSVYDSAVEREVPVSEPIDPVLDSSGRVRLSVSSQFFENPDLVYPVIVDPAVTLGVWFDSYVSSAYPTTDYQSATELLVGTPDAGASKYRAFLNFSSSAWEGTDIISASLKLYLNYSWSCTARSFTVYANVPVSSSLRWGNQPAPYSSGSVTKSAAAGYSSACASTYVTTDVTPTVSYLSGVTSGTAGFSIRATNENDSGGWKHFRSTNAATGKPSLTVTYNHKPDQPGTPSALRSVDVSGLATVPSVYPTLQTTATDVDNDLLTVTFKSYSSASSTIPLATLCSVTGVGPEFSCKPSTALTDQQTYFVRATVSDVWAEALYPSPVFSFKVLATEPFTPVITCPYVNNYSSGHIPSTNFTCTVSASSAPVNYRAAKVLITVNDSETLILDTNVDGSYTQTVTLKAGSFQHRIKATAVSATGIQSTQASHVMSFGYAGVISPQKLETKNNELSISSYARAFGGNLATYASIDWRKTGDSNTAWMRTISNVSVGSKAGVRGIYAYPLNLNTIGVGVLPTNVPVALDLRVCYFYSDQNEEFCTTDNTLAVNRLPSGFDPTVTEQAGPGRVSLTTGVLQLSETDVSVSVGVNTLNVSRTYDATTTVSNTHNKLFGPNWFGSISSDAAALSGFELYTDNATGMHYFLADGGSLLAYRKTSPTTFVPIGDESTQAALVISSNSTAGTVAVTEQDGSQTTFKADGTKWRPVCVRDTAIGRTIFSKYDSAGYVTHTGTVASTIGCGAIPTTLSQGLQYDYVTVNGLQVLDKVSYFYPGQVVAVQAQYGYDSTGRLISVQNLPGTTSSSTTTYSYNASGLVETVTDSGFAPYLYRYDSMNRLVQVQRTQSPTGTAITAVEASFVYDLNPANNSGQQPILSAATASLWGQENAPAFQVAVFGADQQLTLGANNALNLPAATDVKWRSAMFRLLDVNGLQTNTAVYGKTGWRFTATIFDGNKAPIASYSADATEQIIDRYNLEGSASFDELEYASVTRYTTDLNGIEAPKSMYVGEVWSPTFEVTNPDGSSYTARTHTTNTYDEGSPDGLHGLLTTQVLVLTTGPGLDITGATPLQKTVNIFTAQQTGTTSGWVLNRPTKIQQFNGASTTSLDTTYVYNGLGQTIKEIAPGSTGSDARTTIYTYYSAGASTRASCGNNTNWEGLLCYTAPAAATALPTEQISSYDSYLRPTVVTEYGATQAVVRTTTTTYLADGRTDVSEVTALGQVSIKTKQNYDPVTLLNTATELSYGGVLQNTVATSYDKWGRVTATTNSLGETETLTYVPIGYPGAGNVKTVTNGAGVTTYTYAGVDANGFTETRPVVTKTTFVNNSATPFTNTYTAAYNENGQIAKQIAPNDYWQRFEYDNTSRLIRMGYGLPTAATTFLNWSRTYDQYSRVLSETGPNTANETLASELKRTYSYDTKGHLASAKTTSPTSCSLNSYGFDVAGNRTSVSKGNCTTSTTKSFSFNSASQLTNAGYVYDGLGRNTSIPAADSPNSVGVISLSYRVNDQVSSITQNGVATAYSFDGLGRRVSETTGSSVVTKHYTGTSDNPAWSSNNAGVTDIYTSSLGTGLNGTVTLDNGVKTLSLDVNDLRGNTVTRINVDAATTDSWVSFDEYGNREGASTGKLVTYDAYGQYERATTSQGLILMGARVYNPVTNQFTSPDPITGGNETTYTYPNDPINKTDFDGNWGWGDTLDLTLTVASFLPIPGIQQIAWVAKAMSVGSKVLKLSKVAAASSKAATKVGKTLSVTDRAQASGAGVYKFVVAGKTYIGQSKDVARRMAEHARRAEWKGHKIEKFSFEPMPGKSTLERRLFEQELIDGMGGIPKRAGNKKLWNVINAVRPRN
jgi:RHS repeat-associated protein